MTPPQATRTGPDGKPGRNRGASAAVSPCPVERLKARRDFLRAGRGRRQVMPGFILLGRERPGGAAGGQEAARVGFTCSKKLGNAVTRNRAKRRLRALAARVMPAAARPGWDYVLIGRPGATVALPFAEMAAQLETALRRLHAPRRGPGGGGGRGKARANPG